MILLGPPQLRIFSDSLRCLQTTLHVHAGATLGALENILKGAALPHTNVPCGDFLGQQQRWERETGRGQSGRLFSHGKVLNVKKREGSEAHTRIA